MAYITSTVPIPTVPNKQLYNGGSEWQNDYSNMPDYYQTFYRNYDAVLGRFVGVDPAPEGASDLTTYNYAGNNPIRFNDPLGDYKTDPFTEGFNTQVGNIWTDPDVHNGFTHPSADVSFGSSGSYASGSGSDAGGSVGGSGGGSNASHFALLDAAIAGNPLAAEQYAEENAEVVPPGTATYVNNEGQISHMTGSKANYIVLQNSSNRWLFTQLGIYNQSGDPIRGVHVILESETPTIYKNTLNAIKNGLPYILHYDPGLADLNRANILKNYPVVSRSVQRDEYPYASTREGGNGLVFYVPGNENSLQGGHLRALYATLKPGDAFLVFLIAKGQEPENDWAPNSNPIQISPVVKAGAVVGTIMTILTWIGRLAL